MKTFTCYCGLAPVTVNGTTNVWYYYHTRTKQPFLPIRFQHHLVLDNLNPTHNVSNVPFQHHLVLYSMFLHLTVNVSNNKNFPFHFIISSLSFHTSMKRKTCPSFIKTVDLAEYPRLARENSSVCKPPLNPK